MAEHWLDRPLQHKSETEGVYNVLCMRQSLDRGVEYVSIHVSMSEIVLKLNTPLLCYDTCKL